MEISSYWLAFVLVNHLALNDPLIVPVSVLVMMAVFAFPALSSFSFPLDLPSSFFALLSNLVGKSNNLQDILLRLN